MSLTEARALVEQAHREAVGASLSDVADFLQDILGRRLVAYVAGVKDAKTVSRWAKGEVGEARWESERRLRAAGLQEVEHGVKDLAIRMNPRSSASVGSG